VQGSLCPVKYVYASTTYILHPMVRGRRKICFFNFGLSSRCE